MGLNVPFFVCGFGFQLNPVSSEALAAGNLGNEPTASALSLTETASQLSGIGLPAAVEANWG